MQKNPAPILLLGCLLAVAMPGTVNRAQAQAARTSSATKYETMASLDQYLMPNQNAEVDLARSAAPASISGGAEVMVLGRKGYSTVARGRNGFLCLVERSWAAPTDDPDFWNPHSRGPICFNPAAARTVVPAYLMKTRLVLAGKSKSQIVAATGAAFDRKELPAVAPGAMCYMLSKRQYLNNADNAWHPHLMFFAPGEAAKSWGANLPGSPVLASNDPEERATIFIVLAGQWSDGTPDLPSRH